MARLNCPVQPEQQVEARGAMMKMPVTISTCRM
jgi:hypothetical protein